MLYDESSGKPLPDEIAKLIAPDNDDQFEPKGAEHIALEKFEVDAYVYRNDGKADMGVLSSLFAADLGVVQSGVIQEAKRFTTQNVEGKSVEIGVAVRLAVAANTSKLETQLNPENLAAAAQLGLADTRVKIKVVGYLGDIVDLPPVSSLDVKSYQHYLDAFSNIQAQVFNDKSDWSPTVLGWEEKD